MTASKCRNVGLTSTRPARERRGAQWKLVAGRKIKCALGNGSMSEPERGRPHMRKLIAFDDDTFDKLKQLARDRMGTFQELADEAFADLLKKHGIPIDLKDALRKSARLTAEPNKKSKSPKASRKAKS
jgi:hypothetical protein